MAQPFTPEQMQAIRARLVDSAQRHALTTGVRKTSLDTLTAEAGISKSSFYKFYDSKEQLFLEVSSIWERQTLEHASRALDACPNGTSSKARAAAFVFAVFEAIHQMGIVRFLREDLPYLHAFFSQDEARTHCMTSAAVIFDRLHAAHIAFTEPDEIVRAVIQLMYLSILNISELGDNFFPALRALVQSACNHLVA
ncbi:MAG: TetR/AcrR family transcriptional regulator [Candidatus Ventricola sp.]